MDCLSGPRAVTDVRSMRDCKKPAPSEGAGSVPRLDRIRFGLDCGSRGRPTFALGNVSAAVRLRRRRVGRRLRRRKQEAGAEARENQDARRRGASCGRRRDSEKHDAALGELRSDSGQSGDSFAQDHVLWACDDGAREVGASAGGDSQTGVDIIGISSAGKTPDYMRELLLNPQVHRCIRRPRCGRR